MFNGICFHLYLMFFFISFCQDFWERFLDSLRALSAKGQRTVYRLTLVKAWNIEELENYAQLVSIGNPDFIEIKGIFLHCIIKVV